MARKSPVFTEEQRQAPYEHHIFPFIFKSNTDLTDGINVRLVDNVKVTNCNESELYAAMSYFISTWSLDILEHLCGWPGFDCIKYTFEFDVSQLRCDVKRPTREVTKPRVTPSVLVATDGGVCTDAHLQKFVKFLGEHQFEVRIDFEDNIRLMFEDTNIADFVEERIVAFHGLGISTAYFDCSLDYGDPFEMEDDLDYGDPLETEDDPEAEIPKVRIRIYKMAYRDGKFAYAPTEGETIVKLSNMKYTVVRG